jgi:uncharacterized protein (TIGR02118 family)
MIRLNILYPNNEGAKFDLGYYVNIHMPMSIDKFGAALKGVSIEYGLKGGTPGSRPPYIAMAHLLFDSEEAFLEAFNPIAALLIADMPLYTDIEPVYQFSDVKIYR